MKSPAISEINGFRKSKKTGVNLLQIEKSQECIVLKDRKRYLLIAQSATCTFMILFGIKIHRLDNVKYLLLNLFV